MDRDEGYESVPARSRTAIPRPSIAGGGCGAITMRASGPSAAASWQGWRGGCCSMILKFLGILAGVVFGVVLFDQQAATFDRLVSKTVIFIDHAGANMWIAPKNTDALRPEHDLDERTLRGARNAARYVGGAAPSRRRDGLASGRGFRTQITIFGTRYPGWRGGPWKVLQEASMRSADRTPCFEDSGQREAGRTSISAASAN